MKLGEVEKGKRVLLSPNQVGQGGETLIKGVIFGQKPETGQTLVVVQGRGTLELGAGNEVQLG